MQRRCSTRYTSGFKADDVPLSECQRWRKGNSYQLLFFRPRRIKLTLQTPRFFPFHYDKHENLKHIFLKGWSTLIPIWSVKSPIFREVLTQPKCYVEQREMRSSLSIRVWPLFSVGTIVWPLRFSSRDEALRPRLWCKVISHNCFHKGFSQKPAKVQSHIYTYIIYSNWMLR